MIKRPKFQLHLFLLGSILFITSCTKSDLVDGPAVDVRVKNTSAFDFDEVKIWDQDLGSLKKNEVSPYFSKEPAFDLASIYVMIDSFQFGQTVIDYVGEKPLKKGKYTFEVNVTELSNAGRLSQILVKD